MWLKIYLDVTKARLNLRICLQLGSAAILVSPPCSRADTADEVTAVSSRASGDYVRAKLADGSFKPEFYVFGEGGHLTSAGDPAIDRISFMEIARTIAGPLKSQNYVPARDAKATRLLVLVYWGRTGTPESAENSLAIQGLQDASTAASNAKAVNGAHELAAQNIGNPTGTMPCGSFAPSTSMALVADQIDADNAFTGALALAAAENRGRDEANLRNAMLLGYDSLWNATSTYVGTPLEYRRQDLVKELEESRYFVILMAYDFQKVWKQKQHKLLWETRVSIRQRHHEFDKELLAMAQHASPYFGKDSHGLIKRDIPEGRVDIGQMRLVDSGPGK